MTTVNDLIARYRDEEMGHLSPRTRKDYLRNLEILSERFGHMQAEALKPKDIGQFMDVKRGRIQRGKIVSVLANIYRLAVGKWWLVENNPCSNLIMPKAGKRTRYVTPEEFEAVRSIASPPFQIAMDLAYLIGQRQGDLVNLGWDQIDVTYRGENDHGRIHIIQGKTGKEIAIQITDAVRDVLVRAKRRPPAIPRLYVIRTRTGEPFTSTGFRTGWQRLMKRALENGLIATPYTFHDLRAKSASDNDDIEEAAKLLGHQNSQMTKSVYDRNVRVVQPLR